MECKNKGTGYLSQIKIPAFSNSYPLICKKIINMALNAGFQGELQHESGNTLKLLERLPEDKFLWKPHEKSMPLGRLATHIAEIPHWVTVILSDDKYDIGKGFLRGNPPTKHEVLDIFNQYLTEARSSLANASDEMLNANWSMFRNGEFQFGFPKKVGIRNIVLNHIIHHRAQLGVYLRLLDIPIPGMYGPSADDTR